MYLELFRSKPALAVLRSPLRWSMTSLLVLGLICVILQIMANLHFTGQVFGHSPSTESLLLLIGAFLGDASQLVVLLAQKQPLSKAVESRE
jgi:hypothetical protein